MRFSTRTRAASIAAAALLVVVSASCSERLPGGPQAALEPGLSPDFFAAAVSYFDGRTALPILVDPRPLRPEARLRSVSENDLLTAEAETIRMRERVVESAGWRTTDAPADWRCVFAQALPPALPATVPDSLRRHRDACIQRGQYESLIFGLPQSGTDPDHPGRWRIRSVRMLLYGYEIIDLFLERRERGDWEVVESRVLDGVFS